MYLKVCKHNPSQHITSGLTGPPAKGHSNGGALVGRYGGPLLYVYWNDIANIEVLGELLEFVMSSPQRVSTCQWVNIFK